MPRIDPLASQPSADIVEFFTRCANGERLELKLPTRAAAMRLRFRMNQVRARLRKAGQYRDWGIVELTIRERRAEGEPDSHEEEEGASMGEPLGYSLIGQIRDEDYGDAFAEALGHTTITPAPHDHSSNILGILGTPIGEPGSEGEEEEEGTGGKGKA